MKGHSLLVLLVAATLALAGCSMDINVIVHPDDTATVGVETVEKAESTDFIRRMPNMGDYLDAWMQNLREEGVLFDRQYRGENEYIYLQRHVDSLEELSSPQELPNGVRAWTWVERQDQGRVATYRFRGILDTSVFYETAPGADSSVTAEMQKELNAMHMTYSVTLPGRIVYSNATRVRANRATWDVPMNAQTEIVVESQAERPAASVAERSAPLWAWAALGVLLAIGVLDLLVRLALHWRRQA